MTSDGFSVMVVIGIVVVVLCFFICQLFSIIFHLYQQNKPFSNKAISNDDFYFTCLGVSFQIANTISMVSILSLFSPIIHDNIRCILMLLRSSNTQFQVSCSLVISVKRFCNICFKKQFSKANHFILGYVGKGIIFLIPLYMQFITLIVCGTDLFIFCSKDFRDTVNLLSVWDPNENQQQTVNLIYKSFDCRSKLLKRSPLSMCLPIIVITNILIILRSVLINFKTSRISPFPPEAQNTNQELELRTISGQNDPSQQPEDSPHSHQQAASDDNHCPSVGAATGVITVLVITINAVNAGLIMDSGGNALFFTIPDLLVTTILSLCLCFLNCDISNYGLRKFTEHFSVFATSE